MVQKSSAARMELLRYRHIPVHCLCNNMRQASGEKGVKCSTTTSLARLSDPTYMSYGFSDGELDTFSPDRHLTISFTRIETPGRQVFATAVNSRDLELFHFWPLDIHLDPFSWKMQRFSPLLLSTLCHPSWCLFLASPQFCQHTVKMIRQCQWLFKM